MRELYHWYDPDSEFDQSLSAGSRVISATAIGLITKLATSFVR